MEDLGWSDEHAVFDRLVEVADRTVVDAGCGAGGLARHMVARGARVVALDPDPVQARELHRGLGRETGIRFVETGAEAMPCADRSVDGVVFGKSLHHVPVARMSAALAESCRVLKADGFLYVLEPEIEGAYSTLSRPFHDETAERRAASAALESCAAPRFARRGRLRFGDPRRYRDFEAFVASVCSASYNAIPRERVDTAEVRRLFEGGRDGEGYVFEQPMRVDLFREPTGR